MATVAPLDENDKTKAKERGWEIKTSKSIQSSPGKQAEYYYCANFPGGAKSQFETPTNISCPATPKTTCPNLKPTTFTVKKTKNGTFEVTPKPPEQAGGKRKQKKRYGKKTRKLQKQKNKQ